MKITLKPLKLWTEDISAMTPIEQLTKSHKKTKAKLLLTSLMLRNANQSMNELAVRLDKSEAAIKALKERNHRVDGRSDE